MTDDVQRRARLFRFGRLAVLALVIVYFFLPYGARSWIPVWLLFVAALGLELDFFLGGYLQMRRGSLPAETPDRGPQERDLADLGHPPPEWREYEEELRLFPAEWYSEPPAEPAEEGLRPYLRYVAEAAVGLALVAGILFYASRPHGWDAVSAEHQARTESVLSREASLIAGHPATVRCDTSGEYVGFVQDADGLAFVGGDRAYLTPSICDTLYQLAVKHRVQSFSRTARAIAVLGHEAWHLRGVRNEGFANCYGFQSGVRIGVDLGLSESRARAMMREQLATNASDSASSSQYRVPASCRNGGEADLSPTESEFP
jgi:hypothetical protein